MLTQYLIYSDPANEPRADTPESAQLLEAYGAFSAELDGAGAMLAGDALQGTETATTVRVRGGDASVTDGPFAETKEVLGGYYLVDAADLDEAIGWAAKIPSAEFGSIEVRPVMEY